MTASERTSTPIDTIAEAWVDTLADLSPILATYIGRFEHNGRFDDFSPEGAQRYAAAARATLTALEAADAVDEIDRVTKDDLGGELARPRAPRAARTCGTSTSSPHPRRRSAPRST